MDHDDETSIDDPDTLIEPPPFAEGSPLVDDEATVELSADALSSAVGDGRPAAAPSVAALVAEGHPIVRAVAHGLARRLGHRCDVDELCSVGRSALVDAARDYQPERARFAPWLTHRLRWAMLDHLRREPNSRAARRAAALAVAERVVADLPPADVAVEPGGRVQREASEVALKAGLAARAAALATGLVLGAGATDALPDSSPDPEQALLLRSRISRVRGAVASLPEPQRELLSRHYYGGERFDHIAQSLGLSKTRASRLHTKAISELARALAEL